MRAPAHSAPPPALPAELGGYRVVRLLGQDARRVTALVHAEGQSRVARVMNAALRLDEIEREVAVLDRLATAPASLRQHVVALEDLLTLPDGRLVLIMPTVVGPRLSEVLAARAGRLEPGEAVTMLAPVVGAVEQAHELGITGLGLAPTAIRFGSGGAPVLLGVDTAATGPVLPARFREAEEVYDADRRALAALGAHVASALPADQQPALRAVVAAARADRATAAALFDLATPIPVRLGEHPEPSLPAGAADDGAGPVGSTPTSVQRTEVAAVQQGRVTGAVADALRVLGLPPALLGGVLVPLERAEHWVVAALRPRPATRRLAALRPRRAVRPRTVVMGIAGAAALLLAIVIGTGSGAAGDAAADDRAPATRTASPEPAIAGDAAGQPAAVPEALMRPEPGEWDALVHELVERWDACRGSLDDACAASVAHPSSAAAALLRQEDPRHGLLAEWLTSGGGAVVAERMGAVVIVDLVDGSTQTTTASLLLIRSEAGWRVRDVRD